MLAGRVLRSVDHLPQADQTWSMIATLSTMTTPRRGLPTRYAPLVIVAMAVIIGVLLDQVAYMSVIGVVIAGVVLLVQRRPDAQGNEPSTYSQTTIEPPTSREEPHVPVPMTAHGANADVQFDGYQVIIKRGNSFLTQVRGGMTGEKGFPVDAITSVQWQDASTLSSGFIKFLTGGSGPIQGSFGTAAITVALNDPDTVVFKKKSQAEFIQLREVVESARRAGRAHQPAAAPQVDLADQLAKLGALRDAGVLSEEEFAAKKAEILARM